MGNLFLSLFKLGMPLIYVYHLLCGNIFLNFSAEDDRGIEKLANLTLAPIQYVFVGKKGLLREDGQYDFVQRFDYGKNFYIKTAISITALPASFLTGVALKTAAYCIPQYRKHYKLLSQALSRKATVCDWSKYRAMGIELKEEEECEWIAAPKYKRKTSDLALLKEDIEALEQVTSLLKKYKIPFWLDCGTALGAFRHGGVIPWDWDLDLAILAPEFDNTLLALKELDPKKYVVQDWSSRERPKTYLKVYVKNSASMGLIDIYHFKIDEEKKEVATILSNELNIFLPISWKVREKRYTEPMPFSRVFPLKRVLFEGLELFVPGNIEEYLKTFYGENLAPARIYNEVSGEYEKDLSHPYWKLPYAH